MATATVQRTTIPVEVPVGMQPYMEGLDPSEVFMRDAMLLYPQIRNATISHGRAAEILGVHKMDLIEYYGSIGIPYIQISEQELAQEVADFQSIRRTNEDDTL